MKLKITEAMQAGGPYTRLKLTGLSAFDGSNETYFAFSAGLREQGQGFTSNLTYVQTNYSGEMDADFQLEGVGIDVVPDALDVAGNLANAFELLTKTTVVLHIDDRTKVVLGPAYGWPGGRGIGLAQIKSAASTGHADGGYLHRDSDQRRLAEPIILPKGSKPYVQLFTDGSDLPALTGTTLVDIRLMGSGRIDVIG